MRKLIALTEILIEHLEVSQVFLRTVPSRIHRRW